MPPELNSTQPWPCRWQRQAADAAKEAEAAQEAADAAAADIDTATASAEAAHQSAERLELVVRQQREAAAAAMEAQQLQQEHAQLDQAARHSVQEVWGANALTATAVSGRLMHHDMSGYSSGSPDPNKPNSLHKSFSFSIGRSHGHQGLPITEQPLALQAGKLQRAAEAATRQSEAMQQRLAALHETGDAEGAAACAAEAQALEQAATEATVEAEQAVQAAEEQQGAAEVRYGCPPASSCAVHPHRACLPANHLAFSSCGCDWSGNTPSSMELTNVKVDADVVRGGLQ